MKQAIVMMLLGLAVMTPSGLAQGDESGTDISSAIPIYFGQTVNDTMDAQLRPRQVYKVSLARGQQIVATMNVGAGAPEAALNLYLYASTVRTVASLDCGWGDSGRPLVRAGDIYGRRSIEIQYQVPAAGDYYVVACPGSSRGVSFKLQFDAVGTPLLTTLPTQAGCVTGQVDYVEFSLRLIAMGLADEISIGGTRLCPNCPVKAPLYGSMIAKLEEAMRANQPVEACHDANGNVFKLRLTKF